jgi:hypothetical protein
MRFYHDVQLIRQIGAKQKKSNQTRQKDKEKTHSNSQVQSTVKVNFFIVNFDSAEASVIK